MIPTRIFPLQMTALCASFCFCLLTQTLTAHAAPKVLTVVTTEWCPLLCLKSPKKPGMMMEILQKAFPASEYTIELKSLDWKTAIESTSTGKVRRAWLAHTIRKPPILYFPPKAKALSVSASTPHAKAPGFSMAKTHWITLQK